MLSEKKWKFMKNLVEVLKKFEEVTKTLGGSKYVAFSLTSIVSAISLSGISSNSSKISFCNLSLLFNKIVFVSKL